MIRYKSGQTSLFPQSKFTFDLLMIKIFMMFKWTLKIVYSFLNIVLVRQSGRTLLFWPQKSSQNGTIPLVFKHGLSMILHICKEAIRPKRNSNRATQAIRTQLSIPKMSACPSTKKHDDVRFELSGSASTIMTITDTQVVPTINIDDVSCDEDSKRSELKNSAEKSDRAFLKITGKCNNERQRPKSADASYRMSGKSLNKTLFSSLRKVSSEHVINDKISSECICTCLPRDERKCELSGSQLISFYGLWRNEKQITLGKKLPGHVKRKMDYRQCGCKTREFEKQSSKVKSKTCPCHA